MAGGVEVLGEVAVDDEVEVGCVCGEAGGCEDYSFCQLCDFMLAIVDGLIRLSRRTKS